MMANESKLDKIIQSYFKLFILFKTNGEHFPNLPQSSLKVTTSASINV